MTLSSTAFRMLSSARSEKDSANSGPPAADLPNSLANDSSVSGWQM